MSNKKRARVSIIELMPVINRKPMINSARIGLNRAVFSPVIVPNKTTAMKPTTAAARIIFNDDGFRFCRIIDKCDREQTRPRHSRFCPNFSIIKVVPLALQLFISIERRARERR